MSQSLYRLWNSVRSKITKSSAGTGNLDIFRLGCRVIEAVDGLFYWSMVGPSQDRAAFSDARSFAGDFMDYLRQVYPIGLSELHPYSEQTNMVGNLLDAVESGNLGFSVFNRGIESDQPSLSCCARSGKSLVERMYEAKSRDEIEAITKSNGQSDYASLFATWYPLQDRMDDLTISTLNFDGSTNALMFLFNSIPIEKAEDLDSFKIYSEWGWTMKALPDMKRFTVTKVFDYGMENIEWITTYHHLGSFVRQDNSEIQVYGHNSLSDDKTRSVPSKAAQFSLTHAPFRV